MKKMDGSHEVLFSRRAIKYREQGLNDKKPEESDYCPTILDEYTLLKRPVTILNDKLFIGNDQKKLEALKNAVIQEQLFFYTLRMTARE